MPSKLNHIDESHNYDDVLNVMKDYLDKNSRRRDEQHSPEDEETFEEEESQRVYAKFLKPDGKELILPGVSDKDSMSYRIEALREYLEQTLGDMVLLEAYQHLHESEDSISS